MDAKRKPLFENVSAFDFAFIKFIDLPGDSPESNDYLSEKRTVHRFPISKYSGFSFHAYAGDLHGIFFAIREKFPIFKYANKNSAFLQPLGFSFDLHSSMRSS
jgi:hypothetical protein